MAFLWCYRISCGFMVLFFIFFYEEMFYFSWSFIEFYRPAFAFQVIFVALLKHLLRGYFSNFFLGFLSKSK